jgi:DNA repair exonuclease SbcCD ATPase subunit
MADEEPAAAAEPLEEAAPPKEGGDVAPDEVAASGGAEAVEGAAVDTAEGEQTPELGGGDDEPAAATGEDGEDADEGTLAPADGDPEPAEEEYEEDEAVEPDDLGDEDDGYEGGEGYGDFDMLEAAEVDADEEQVEEDKANLAELFKQAQEEKATFLDLNQVLQKKLAEHLRTSAKKMDESKDIEKSVTDQEQRYYKFLAQVNELRDELKRLQQQHDKTAMEMKRRLDDKQGKAEEIKAAFVEFKREILKGAENSRTSKPIPPKLIAAFENQESEKDEEVERVISAVRGLVSGDMA